LSFYRRDFSENGCGYIPTAACLYWVSLFGQAVDVPLAYPQKFGLSNWLTD